MTPNDQKPLPISANQPATEQIMMRNIDEQISYAQNYSENTETRARRPKIPQTVAAQIKINSKGKKIEEEPNPLASTIYKIRKSFACQMCSCEYEEQLKKMCSCEHQFCKNCLKEYFNYKLSMFEEIFCPSEECDALLDQNRQFYVKLPEGLKKKYIKIHKFYVTAKNPNLRLCPLEKCEDGILTLVQSVNPVCDKCGTTFCCKCFLEVHDGSCDEQEVKFYENNMKFRQCKKCQFVIERTEGCNHITCKCGYEFCYICGQKWGGNSHICPENDEELNNIEGILCDSSIGWGIPKILGRIFFSVPAFILVIIVFIIVFLLRFVFLILLLVLSLIPTACKLGFQICGVPVMVLFFLPLLVLAAMVLLIKYMLIPHTYIVGVQTQRSMKRCAIKLFR